MTLSPSSFGGSLTLQQHVHAELGARNGDFDTVLEIGPDSITLVGFALGQRMFTLRYDGKRLTETRHPLLPAEVRGADILTDLQLALWPVEAVRAALPSDYSVEDGATTRTIQRDGHQWMDVKYDGPSRAIGHIEIQNVQFGYRIDVRSAAVTP